MIKNELDIFLRRKNLLLSLQYLEVILLYGKIEQDYMNI